MTTKQIAEAVGKPERTVRDWVRLAAKSAVIAAKLAASSPMKPADYDLAEVCQIIEEGLGAAAADAYRTNAANAALEATRKPIKAPNGKQLQVLAHNLPPAEFRAMALSYFAPWLLTENKPVPEQIEGPTATAITRKAASVGAAAAHRVATQAINRANDEKRQGKLPLGQA